MGTEQKPQIRNGEQTSARGPGLSRGFSPPHHAGPVRMEGALQTGWTLGWLTLGPLLPPLELSFFVPLFLVSPWFFFFLTPSPKPALAIKRWCNWAILIAFILFAFHRSVAGNDWGAPQTASHGWHLPSLCFSFSICKKHPGCT